MNCIHIETNRGERQMKIRHRLIRYSVYRNMFLSFLLLTSIMIIIVCGGLFALFSWSTAKEVGNISESMLQQNSFVAKVIKDQVYNLGNQLLNNKAVMTAMLDKDHDRIKAYHAMTEMRAIQTNFPFIEMIGLYNRSAEQYINTSGISFEEEKDSLLLIEESRKAYFNFTPRTVNKPGIGGGTFNVLTFFLMPSYYSQLPASSIIIINIDEKYVQKMIGGYKNYSNDSLFVMDGDGTVITHSDPAQFMRNLSFEPYAKRVLAAEKDAGYFNVTFEGKKNLVSYVKSSDMNWVFVSMSKYDDLLFNMNALKWATLGIALFMFVLSFIVSVWLTNHTYNPIRNLMDKIIGQMAAGQLTEKVNEFDLLDTKFSDITGQLTAMESAKSAARRAELLNYFKGSQGELSPLFRQEWEGPNFVVIQIMIDSLDHFRRANSNKQQSLLHFAICNIAEELLTGLFKFKLLIIEEGEFGVLVQLEQDSYPPQIVVQLQELQSKISSYFKLSLSIGIGPIVPAMDNIRESYLLAKESHRQRFFEGQGGLFEYQENVEGDSALKDRPYPLKLEKRLVDAIRMNSRQKAIAEVELFIKEMEHCEYQQALFFLNQLAISLYKQFNTGSRKDNAGAALLPAFFRRLPAFETLEEIGEELKTIVGELSDRLKEAANDQNMEVIEGIKGYVKENYAKPDLSLEWMAGQVNLSRGYLGKLFKAQCGMSFSDYLNSVRLERAKELLQSDEPIQVISEQVGIYNTTYFYTLFKKNYQMSPAQYRTQLGKELKDSIKN
ncbi:AraC family transcriptional regulator [Paenibacillaceae bacterium]|nr:AraC family transcriptional regulator [Paenibacillaceae bacterium]